MVETIQAEDVPASASEENASNVAEVIPTSPDHACLVPRSDEVEKIVKYNRCEYFNGGKWLNDPDKWGAKTKL